MRKLGLGGLKRDVECLLVFTQCLLIFAQRVKWRWGSEMGSQTPWVFAQYAK